MNWNQYADSEHNLLNIFKALVRNSYALNSYCINLM